VTAALGGEGSEAIVEVRDTGPGIPDAEREHVLKRFVRLEESRNEPGSGLGLSLVAAVARLHDAKLTLRDAKPGLGVRLAFHRKAAG
jgi:signal transduction histidine kinase